MLADILRSILLLNDPAVIEYLLSDDAFCSVAGIFEYDRSLKERAAYRAFFSQQARMRLVLPGLSQEMRSASAFLFRLRYVRDIMLHPTIDEPGVTAINSMITFTSGEICFQVLTDTARMAELLQLALGAPSPAPPPAPAPLADGEPQPEPLAPHASLQPQGSGCGWPAEAAEMGPEALAGAGLGCSDGVVSSRSPLDALRFLRELVTLSKFIVLDKRVGFYRAFLAAHRADFFRLLQRVFSQASLGLRARSLQLQQQSTKASSRRLRQQPQPAMRASSDHDGLGGPFRSEELQEAVAIAAEVLAAFAGSCPALIRQEILEDSKPAWGPCSGGGHGDSSWMQHSLLFLLIDMLLNAHDVASIELLGDCLKALLDFDRPSVLPDPDPAANSSCSSSTHHGYGHGHGHGAKADKDRFLPLFYEHYAAWLLAPFLSRNEPVQPIEHSFYVDECMMRSLLPYRAQRHLQPGGAVLASRRVLFELLTLCVRGHSYRAKYFLIRSNHVSKIVSKVFPGANPQPQPQPQRGGQRALQLGALKLLRAILSLKDEFYFRHVEKLDILRPVFVAFQAVARKDNMLTSSVCELLELLRAENITTLIAHVVEKYAACFADMVHVDVFEGLKLRYEQRIDQSVAAGAAGAASGGQAAARNRRLRELDKEEDYFFGEDNDDDDGGAGAGAGEGDCDGSSESGNGNSNGNGNGNGCVEVTLDVEQLHVQLSNDSSGFGSMRHGIAAAASGFKKVRRSSSPPMSSSSSTDSQGSQDSPDGASSGLQFLASLRHKRLSVPARPGSPPRYSHRKHGSPLDGDVPDAFSNSNSSNSMSSARDSGSEKKEEEEEPSRRLMALLSEYGDDSCSDGQEAQHSSSSSSGRDYDLYDDCDYDFLAAEAPPHSSNSSNSRLPANNNNSRTWHGEWRDVSSSTSSSGDSSKDGDGGGGGEGDGSGEGEEVGWSSGRLGLNHGHVSFSMLKKKRPVS